MTTDVVTPRFLFRQVAFTGPKLPAVKLDFVDGLNVVWGASNTGKSFLVKALDFMMGAGSLLPGIEERQGYDTAWLQMVLPRGPVTLSRSTKGGNFALYDGLVEPSDKLTPRETLMEDHAAKSPSLSGMLLSELGLGDHRIAKNQNGEKAAFTFRHYATYVFTEETDMIGAGSPIQISEFRNPTLDKNVLKFILTGLDDSSVIETKSAKIQKSTNAGKIEIVQEMLATAERELARDFPDHADLYDQKARIDFSVEDLRGRLSLVQQDIDTATRARRTILDSLADANERATDIALMLTRFALLNQVFESDMQRLAALEEGGAALLAGSRRVCPLCGADPEHQHADHGYDEVMRSQQAVRAEVAKIRREKTDLLKATSSLTAEREGLLRKIELAEEQMKALDATIAELTPLEDSSRERYESFDLARGKVAKGIALLETVRDLEKRKTELEAYKPTPMPKNSISVGIDGVIGHGLAKSVQKVLESWHFPGLDSVSFHEASHDILINGKDRASNGKGVRALMNAAFKIGVLQYCRSKALPHPGILVLDSPLLSYREPLTSRHGPLSADEVIVVKSGVKERFYDYLVAECASVQFVIIENDPPVADLGDGPRVTAFTGRDGDGSRAGFFPKKGTAASPPSAS